jgi:uroporphyrin-III C-methyltransferase
MTGKVYLVGAGPGDPGLLTIKGKTCIEGADVIFYDRLVSREILDLARPDTELVYVGKTIENHSYHQDEIHQMMIHQALMGKTVARIQGGDPFVYGRGAEEAEALRAHGIPFEIVPGVTSAIAVPAYAGIPLTYRGVANGFHVVTGHEAAASSDVDWKVLAASRQTLVVLMGVHHLHEIAQRLLRYGKRADTPVAVIEWGTTARQVVVTGTLSNIVADMERARIDTPAVIVIGDVVRLADRLQWFLAGQ